MKVAGVLFTVMFALFGLAAGFEGLVAYLNAQSAIHQTYAAGMFVASATCFVAAILASIESMVSQLLKRVSDGVDEALRYQRMSWEANLQRYEELMAAVDHIGTAQKRPHEKPAPDSSPAPVAKYAGDGASTPANAFRIVCPNCDQALNVAEKLAGRERKCPGCGGSFVVPQPPIR
jgi:hypothetical protein